MDFAAGLAQNVAAIQETPDDEPGAGIAFQIAIEDAAGLRSQARAPVSEIEDKV